MNNISNNFVNFSKVSGLNTTCRILGSQYATVTETSKVALLIFLGIAALALTAYVCFKKFYKPTNNTSKADITPALAPTACGQYDAMVEHLTNVIYETEIKIKVLNRCDSSDEVMQLFNENKGYYERAKAAGEQERMKECKREMDAFDPNFIATLSSDEIQRRIRSHQEKLVSDTNYLNTITRQGWVGFPSNRSTKQ